MFTTTRTRTINNSDNTDIIHALATDNNHELTKLINNFNVNRIIDSRNNFTALHYAIKFNNNIIIDFLLNLGANPELKTLDNQDCYDLSLKFQSKYVITYFLKEKKDLNDKFKKIVSSLEKKIKENEEEDRNYLIESIEKSGFKNDTLKEEIHTLKKSLSESTSKNYSLNEDIKTVRSELKTVRNELIISNDINQKLESNVENLKRRIEEKDISYENLLKKQKK